VSFTMRQGGETGGDPPQFWDPLRLNRKARSDDPGLFSLSLLVAQRVDLPAANPNNHHWMDIYEEIVKLRQEGRRGAVATIVNVRGSIPSFKTAKMLVRDDGSIVGTIGGGCVEADVWQAAREVMEAEKPRTLSFNLNQDPKYDTGLVCGGTLDIFVEPVLPPALLYLFGAGHVAVSLYKAAKSAGFDVIVVDDRDAYANRERFPEARELYAEDFEQAMGRLAPNESSYIVIVTRGHRDDMRVLRWAVKTPARYVGMIGSKRKTIAIFKELQKEGLEAELFERVHAPVGLDIGAITPEEIAVAITAELIAVRRHAERALPHMSWFHEKSEEPSTSDSAAEAVDKNIVDF
jgi:xanthine dehydrogenase accessory factor